MYNELVALSNLSFTLILCPSPSTIFPSFYIVCCDTLHDSFDKYKFTNNGHISLLLIILKEGATLDIATK